ncbi:MAG: two-component system chemotaxis sensor kinase CheA [Paracoccaceae bacterium]|jgi:two-component system chemotaxis sensor kinase CheA
MDDLLTEFLTETVESLDNLDLEIVQLEQNPNDPELLGNIFRLVHTIKGTCGFIGLSRLESVAHAGENVLGNFREGVQEVTPEAVSLILAALDRIKEIVAVLEETESEPPGDDKELIAQLDAMYRAGKEGGAASAPAEPAAAVEAAPAAEAPGGSIYERAGATSAIDAAIELMYGKVMADEELAPLFEGVDMARMQGHTVEYMIKAFGGPDDYFNDALKPFFAQMAQNGFSGPHFNKVGDYLAAAMAVLEIDPAVVDDAMMVFVASEGDFVSGAEAGEAPAEEAAPEVEEEAEVEAVAEEAKPEKAEKSGSKETSVANQSIRVNVELLENLMTTVSELVLTRNQLLQMVRHHEDSEFKVPLQRLSHVTTDLQEGVMKTRMQPIGNAWNKLPRIIRDIGNDLDKKIELKMIGAETELDRQVLEMIKDPLTHMIRNSGDHGLEGPEERVKAGKPETGTVTLNAYHEGGHIIIEIADDGRGINIARVKEKILANGLAAQSEIEDYSDQQIQQFIFKAGFSTAEKVTNVSGRGVGMDVVRTNIEKIGGQIELRSEEGKGSTFIIKIPLTLAIVSALIVRAGTEKFAIPQLSVVELVRVSSASDHRIEKVNETPVLRLRDRLLPLVSLPNLLNLGSDDLLSTIEAQQVEADAEAESAEAAESADKSDQSDKKDKSGMTDENGDSFIVVAQVGPYTFGIVVDAVYDTEEIVVKPVAPILRDISVYSGNTILGDGSVIMILDPNGIATATGSIAATNPNEEAGAAVNNAGRNERTALLVFRAGTDEPKAVPLALIARLEEIEAENVEVSDNQLVVQYRGQLMPLLPVTDTFERRTEGRQPVLVFTDRDRSMGLMVDEILDIVEENLNVEIKTDTDGVIGSAIVDGKATEIIDASSYLTRAYQDWFGRTDEGAENGGASGRVLLVDDSPFFRNLMAPLLRAAGYDVLTAENADAALSMRDAGELFDVIVSDIEMPGMDGFGLAREIREKGAWTKTPIVALSSRTSPADIAAGREVGFVDYVPKQDREALLESLSNTIVKMKGAA